MPSTPPRPNEPELPASIGRYSILRAIGEGAMGRVLLAHDPVLDREVAVKHLRGDLKIPRDVRAGLVTRMRHEARAAARVAHPNLVVLHDMGEDESIGLYLVFEYVEGPTLKQRIVEGPLPPAEVASLARDLGAALTLAHAAGILHRDVKPENVILSKSGGKLADFGIARIPDSTLTHQGGLMGTPAYSAPETFRAGKFSPESDQFSLAATLYEALSAERAFPGDDAVAVAAKIANDAPEPFAARLGLSASVDEVLGRALDRKPERRFPSCADFGAALAQALRATPSAAAMRLAEAPFKGGPATPLSTQASAGAGEIPRERTTGQVILGAAVVVVTATLLVRTALRSSDETGTDPAAPVPAASHSAGAPSAHPHGGPPTPPILRPPPRASASAAPAFTATASAPEPPVRASASASTVVPDAGAPPASASAASPPAPPSASATINANPH